MDGWPGEGGRGKDLAGCVTAAVTPMATGLPDSLLINPGFVIFERASL